MEVISVRPQTVSDCFLTYQIPFDIKAEVSDNVLVIDRHICRNYNLECCFGRDPVELCASFAMDWPPGRELVLHGDDVERKAWLNVKFDWRNNSRIGLAPTIQITGFNAKSPPKRGTRQSVTFKLGDVAKYIKDGVKITLELSRPQDDPQLRSDIGAALITGDHSDVALECGGRVFPCHKVILAARSAYFAAMFKNGFKENAENRVVVKDVDPEAMEALLKFLYTGGVSWVSISVELLKAADMYLVSGLKKECCKVLAKEVTAYNCCQMLEVGNQYDDKLFDRAIEVLVANGQDILKSDEFNDMAENGQLWKRISVKLLEKIM